MNKFIILMPLYNVESWIGLALYTLKLQTYNNFECYIINDKSTDNSQNIIENIIKDDPRFTLINNNINNGSQLGNCLKAFDLSNPNNEDIIIIHDGDDWLSSVFVLEYLNQIYDQNMCWMTYGNEMQYPSMETADHQMIEIPDVVDQQNLYRQFPFIYTHLRTSKSFLWKNLNRKDLIDPLTNDYFRHAADVAVCIPFSEMCGKEKMYCIKDTLLILNRTNPESVHNTRLYKQKQAEAYIRTLTPYKKLQT